MTQSKISFEIKIDSDMVISVYISKSSKVNQVIQSLHKILPYFEPIVFIENYYKYYRIWSEDDAAVLSILVTILEEI